MAGNHYTSHGGGQQQLPNWGQINCHRTEAPVSNCMQIQETRMSQESYAQSTFGAASSRPPPSYNYHWQMVQNENIGYRQQIPVPRPMQPSVPQVTLGQPQVHQPRMAPQTQTSGINNDRFGHYYIPRDGHFGAFDQFKISGNGINPEDPRNLQASKSARQNFDSSRLAPSNSVSHGASLHQGVSSRSWYKMPEETYENGRVVQQTVPANMHVQNQAVNPTYQSSLSTSVHQQHPVPSSTLTPQQASNLQGTSQTKNDGTSGISRYSQVMHSDAGPGQIQPRHNLSSAPNGGQFTNGSGTQMQQEKQVGRATAPSASNLKLNEDWKAHLTDLLRKSLINGSAPEAVKRAYDKAIQKASLSETNATQDKNFELRSRPLEKEKIPTMNKRVQLTPRSLESENVPEITLRNRSNETVDNTECVTRNVTAENLDLSAESETVGQLLSAPGMDSSYVYSEPISQFSSNEFENMKALVMDENSPFEITRKSTNESVDNNLYGSDANNLNVHMQLKTNCLTGQIISDNCSQNDESETVNKVPASAVESQDLLSKSGQKNVNTVPAILATQVVAKNSVIEEPGRKVFVVDAESFEHVPETLTPPQVSERQTISGKESDLELSSDLYDPPLPVITHKKRQERISPLKKYGGSVNLEKISSLSENNDFKKSHSLLASLGETPVPEQLDDESANSTEHPEVAGKKLRHKSSEVSSSSSPRYDDTACAVKSSEMRASEGALKQIGVTTKDDKVKQSTSKTCSPKPLKKTDSQSNDGSKYAKHEKTLLASARDKVYSKWSGSYNGNKSKNYTAKFVGHERRKSCPETDISKPGKCIEKRCLTWNGSESPKNKHPQNKDLASNDCKKSLLPSNGSRVLFHGHKLLQLRLSNGDFFVMEELMKCFKGHDSQQVRKTKTCTLKINFVPLTHSKGKVESYLRSRKISFPSQIEIISVSDAHHLFHYVNKMDSCEDEKGDSSKPCQDKDIQKKDAKERSISPDSTVRHQSDKGRSKESSENSKEESQIDKSRSKESSENSKEDSLQDEVQHNSVSSQSLVEGEELLPFISDCEEPEDTEADRLSSISDSTDIYCEGKPLSSEKTKQSVHQDPSHTSDTLVVTKHMKGGYAIIEKPGEPEKQLRFIYVRGEKCYLYQDLFLLFGKESVVKIVIHQLMSIKDCTEDEAEILSGLQPDSAVVDPSSNKLIREKYVRKIFAYCGEDFPKRKHLVESYKDKTYSTVLKKTDNGLPETLSVSNRTPMKNNSDQQKNAKGSEVISTEFEENMEIDNKQPEFASSIKINGEHRGTKRLRSEDSCDEPDFKKHLSEEMFNGSREYILKAFLSLQKQNQEMSFQMARLKQGGKEAQENKSELLPMHDGTKELIENLKKELGETNEKTTVLEKKCREQEDLLKQTHEDLAKKNDELSRVENERDHYMEIIENITATYRVADELAEECFGCGGEEESSQP